MSRISSGNEIVLSLVGAVGTDLSFVEEVLKECLAEFNYQALTYKISDFFTEDHFQKFNLKIQTKDNFSDVLSKMQAGNKVRNESHSNNYLAAYSILKIFSNRQQRKAGDPTGQVHIIRSLKHPDEASLLRNVYGVGYFQIGVYSSELDRIDNLTKRKIKKSDALKLIEKDIGEEEKYGQQTRDTFQLSDVFIHLKKDDLPETKKQIERFLDLVFGHPHITPTKDEQAMYMAFAYSFRSGDLSRQVGAALVSNLGEIIGLGSNDVPKFGGGAYWPDDELDQRDFAKGFDSNEKIRNEIIVNVMKQIYPRIKSEKELLEKAKGKLKNTGIFDITEFSRAVHAEMSALLSAARTGISTQNSSIYCTTFPCHNCAKHIVSSGVKRVIFVEPYPKSQAPILHSDSICFDNSDASKVAFEPFAGIAARRYIDLFSLKLGLGREITRKVKGTGDAEKFTRSKAQVRVPLVAISYVDSEKYAIAKIIGWSQDEKKQVSKKRKKADLKFERRKN